MGFTGKRGIPFGTVDDTRGSTIEGKSTGKTRSHSHPKTAASKQAGEIWVLGGPPAINFDPNAYYVNYSATCHEGSLSTREAQRAIENTATTRQAKEPVVALVKHSHNKAS